MKNHLNTISQDIQLKEGDRVKFSGRINNIADVTEKTGINLSTLLFIQLSEIEKL